MSVELKQRATHLFTQALALPEKERERFLAEVLTS